MQNMVPSLQYKQVLKHVEFPVFILPDVDSMYERDGLLLFNERVVDDRNQEYKTIGLRRLHTPHKTTKLNKYCENFLDLIKIGENNYIDNTGLLFHYSKSIYCKVKALRIEKKIPKETHTLLKLKGVNFFIPVKRPPLGAEWAHMLYYENRPWMLWDLSQEFVAEYKRKI